MHGGVVTTLMDEALGGVIASVRGMDVMMAAPHTTVEMNASFLAACRPGDRIIVRRGAVAGRRVAFGRRRRAVTTARWSPREDDVRDHGLGSDEHRYPASASNLGNREGEPRGRSARVGAWLRRGRLRAVRDGAGCDSAQTGRRSRRT
jgi:hypothetical protein